jgi:hypothetical protein
VSGQKVVTYCLGFLGRHPWCLHGIRNILNLDIDVDAVFISVIVSIFLLGFVGLGGVSLAFGNL